MADIEGVLAGLSRVLGEILILADGNVVVVADEKDGEKELEKEKVAAGQPKVHADRTYATETANTSLTAGAMLITMSIIRVGQSKSVSVPIDEDSLERIMQCIQTLGEVKDRAAGRARDVACGRPEGVRADAGSAREVRSREAGQGEREDGEGRTGRQRLDVQAVRRQGCGRGARCEKSRPLARSPS